MLNTLEDNGHKSNMELTYPKYILFPKQTFKDLSFKHSFKRFLSQEAWMWVRTEGQKEFLWILELPLAALQQAAVYQLHLQQRCALLPTQPVASIITYACVFSKLGLCLFSIQTRHNMVKLISGENELP